ncbi:hypothetical protein ARMSODRAFT_958288 [Armillaria solidipes]|uniref:Uncharacterized protein n=1 Tax=Armillaria solidipes TaxID=1076256 RepID=A0A2H3BCL9_9AGAR|nr:hypothetical protein ARMSODRAFT_958288 [Armillaria solidipes]
MYEGVVDTICLNTLLQNNVQSIPADFSKRLFKMQASKTAPHCDAAKSFGYGYPTTVPMAGETLSSSSLIRWYTKQIFILAFTDKQAGSALFHYRHFFAPSIDMMHPKLMAVHHSEQYRTADFFLCPVWLKPRSV